MKDMEVDENMPYDELKEVFHVKEDEQYISNQSNEIFKYMFVWLKER